MHGTNQYEYLYGVRHFNIRKRNKLCLKPCTLKSERKEIRLKANYVLMLGKCPGVLNYTT